MNSHCSQIDEYLDGLLNKASATRFESHLESCAACRSEVEIERNLNREVVSAWNDVFAPEHIGKNLHSMAEPTDSGLFRKWCYTHRSRILSAGVSIAAMVLLIVSVAHWHLSNNQMLEFSKAETPVKVSNAIGTTPVESNQLPMVTVISRDDSNSIFVPQAESKQYTILRAYTALPVKTDSNEKSIGE